MNILRDSAAERVNKCCKDIASTQECIEHWKRMRDDPNTTDQPSTKDCALCEIYLIPQLMSNYLQCNGCPIRTKTGKILCEGSPYGEAKRHFMFALNRGAGSLFYEAMNKEINFLEIVLCDLEAKHADGARWLYGTQPGLGMESYSEAQRIGGPIYHDCRRRQMRSRNMGKYDDIDKAIYQAIEQGLANTAMRLESLLWGVLQKGPDGLKIHPLVVLDKRLQALRKRGVIEFDRENRVWRRNA